MGCKLEELVEKLQEFPIVDNYFSDPEEQKLLRKKGVYPYEWFNKMERLEEEELPEHKDFYSSLDNKNISKEDYEYACKIWKEFKCKKDFE